MTSSEEEIKKAIQDYIAKAGGVHAGWYVGTSRHPRKALFEQHRVARSGDWWLFKRAASSAVAHDVENYFVRVVGTDGWTDGEASEADYVYAYRKNAQTCP
ncbi:MAG TPA: hypothetical protein VNE39_06550 [Planctomycetota bacterium]|nr:hypothetical protein [Planctomycetota bacterium]